MRQQIDEQSQVAEANRLLDFFATYTTYRHGARNPYLIWLRGLSALDPVRVAQFYCYWYPVSRRQPQMLLRCAAAYPDRADRERVIVGNYLEEDGLIRAGDDPHYDLLEELIHKIGGRLTRNRQSSRRIDHLYRNLADIAPAEASGALAAIEYPALDISAYFHETIARSGHERLLSTDPYLTIHVRVEPSHIISSHRTALHYMKMGRGRQVLAGFRRVMAFWQEFWPAAFAKLQYPSPVARRPTSAPIRNRARVGYTPKAA